MDPAAAAPQAATADPGTAVNALPTAGAEAAAAVATHPAGGAQAAATVAAAAAATGGSSAVWGVLLALAAAAGNNIGKGLQKAATRGLPALSLRRRDVVLAYVSNPVWVGGLLLDVAGGGAMLAALATTPVSLVQPVAAFGLVLLAGFSHFVLKEHLTADQWSGAAVATCGIIGMGISSSGSGSSSTRLAAPEAAGTTASAAAAGGPLPSPGRVLFWFVLLLGCLGLHVFRRQQHTTAAAARRRRLGPAAAMAADSSSDSSEAAMCGLEAGCCFGFSAAAARTGFQLSKQLGWLLVPLGVLASLGLTSSGLVLQTQGFKHGSALVVCTTAAASSIVAGVLLGLLALSEPLPASWGMKLLLLGSWAAAALGVGSMSGHTTSSSSGSSSSAGGVVAGVLQRASALLQPVLLLLPRGFRRRLLRAWNMLATGNFSAPLWGEPVHPGKSRTSSGQLEPLQVEVSTSHHP